MHRFFVGSGARPGLCMPLSKEDSQHALRVLRLENGAVVEAADGAGGLYAGRLAVDGLTAAIEITASLDSREAPVRVTIYQGLPKADKLDFVTQKATEIGAAAIVPVRMQRAVVRVDRADGIKKAQRLQKIAQEAVKQCGRAQVPSVSEPLDFGEMLSRLAGHELVLMPWENAADTRIRDVYQAHAAATDIACIIGPEGGIDAREAEALMQAGAISVTLGPRILRTETAALVTLSQIMNQWGDM